MHTCWPKSTLSFEADPESTFPQQASQEKKLTFEGIHGFQTIFKGKGMVPSVSTKE